MSENLFKLWTTQFSTNLELKLQQKGSLLRGKVAEGFHVGKQASPINQIGSIALKAPAGRFAPKNRTDADFTRRWVLPQDGEIDQLIDSFDELKTIVDPKGKYGENASNAVGRAWDDALIAAATSNTSQIGADAGGLSAETFDTTKFQIADTFGAAASAGLSVDKLIEAKRILRKYHNELEMDEPTLVIGSSQEADLFRQQEVISKDYNDKPVLVDGRIVRLLGFNVVVSERLTQTTANSIRGCLVFVKSGLYLGMWKDMVNRVSIRNDLSGEPYDLYTAVSYGATRTQPGKVLQILAADTSGADITT